MNNPIINTPNGNVFAPGLKKRGQNLRGRAAHGINNGSINTEEKARLGELRTEARAELAEAKGDNGWVGPRERMALHQDLNQISRTIFRFKHN